ncbi:MAG: hypothetical protein VR72_12345 [Clostridiaceae bacterium BRH_c20a]|nr:MAG: hypothetical protein VR72_12345 [Clostridiaceae bacterium BRH_c20a]
MKRSIIVQKEIDVPIFDLVISFTNTLDLISPLLVNHHKQVSYIAYEISAEMGLSFEEQKNIMLAGALHDIGGITVQERIGALQFEAENPHLHAETGYSLFKASEPFAVIAGIIRYHHNWWEKGEDFVPLGSHIVHLADRVAISIEKEKDILSQVDDIVSIIEKQSGRMFMPSVVHAFKELARKEVFWFNATSQFIVQVLKEKVNPEYLKMDMEGLSIIAKIFSQIIDFRSPFTANHSSGVAATSEALARLLCFSTREQLMIKIAGLLHDVGKLAIPQEILEKAGPLTKEEFCRIKVHTYYTYRTLAPITELSDINRWCSFHHERLDGTGYPFRLKGDELPLGSRILAVADVFTAITEERPYRRGMTQSEALAVLNNMSKGNALDKRIVELLIENYGEINLARLQAQKEVCEDYRTLFAEHKDKEITFC